MRSSFELILCALALFSVAGFFGVRYLSAQQAALEANQEALLELITTQQTSITEAQMQITALLAANQTVAEQLKIEAEGRLAAEQASKAAQGKLTQLEQTIENNKAPNTSAIVSQWRPRVAAVDCEWPVQNNKRATKAGTAVLLPHTDSVQLLTSKHVVTYLDTPPESCTLTFPGQEEKVKFVASQITTSDTKYDWAKITIGAPPAFVGALALQSAPRCTTTAATGDSVIILGYPKIGSKNDITATEGIISGFEDNYYITSAKVERGNSGGAAILTKQNCYLGIPTFVDAGEIESLARILDQRIIEK